MFDLSVIVCTHNPRRDYLRRTLTSLQNQSLPTDRWELLIVDNASRPPLQDDLAISWHPSSRVVREEELGLTPARLRGIRESTGRLLLFVDDDNVLAEGYLEGARELMSTHPHLGVIGAGRLEPEFETQPSDELKPLLPMLALRSVTCAMWSSNPSDSSCIPWGAGLCVRREVAVKYESVIRTSNWTSVLDRKGHQLFSGGDDVFSWMASRMGVGFGIFPELRITHLIVRGRLTRPYFLRLIHDHTFSHAVIRFMLSRTEPQPPRLVEFARALLHGMRSGRFSMRCRLASLRGAGAAMEFIADRKLRPI